MALSLKIITPDGIFFDGLVTSVNVRTTEGEIGILEWHTPIIANIAISTMMYRLDERMRKLSIAGGLLITNLHEVRIITDKIEYISVLKDQAAAASQARVKNVRGQGN